MIAVRGEGWRAFLDNLLSNSVETLAPGELRAALLLTPQGKFLFDLFVGVHSGPDGSDGALIDVQADRRASLIARLKLYRLRARSRSRNWTGRYSSPGAARPRPARAGWPIRACRPWAGGAMALWGRSIPTRRPMTPIAWIWDSRSRPRLRAGPDLPAGSRLRPSERHRLS
ncbi:MAG: hypothetical protein WDN45_09165 [Caulobacteraceae bacterium]